MKSFIKPLIPLVLLFAFKSYSVSAAPSNCSCNNLTVQGSATVAGSLTAGGSAAFGGSLAVDGAAAVAGDFSVAGNATINGGSPVLDTGEQLYIIRGTIPLANIPTADAGLTFGNLVNPPPPPLATLESGIKGIPTTIGNPNITQIGQGFSISPLFGEADWFPVLGTSVDNPLTGFISVLLYVEVFFDEPYDVGTTPTITTNLQINPLASNDPNYFLLPVNYPTSAFLISQAVTPLQVTNTGCVLLAGFSFLAPVLKVNDPVPPGFQAFANEIVKNAQVNFIATGTRNSVSSKAAVKAVKTQ